MNEIEYIRKLSEKAVKLEHQSIDISKRTMEIITINESKNRDLLFAYFVSGCAAVAALAFWAGASVVSNILSDFNWAIEANTFFII